MPDDSLRGEQDEVKYGVNRRRECKRKAGVCRRLFKLAVGLRRPFAHL